ncbi:MAG TPA: hypothetical protein PLC13_01755 [Bacillota bacterium]|jgi:hypothetical protein|nr:hypothetical protein [Bacillota bacterium]
MAVTREQLERISKINEKEHAHIVDSFAVLGREPEKIAIRQGIDLEYIILILRAYDLQLGNEWEDERDDIGIWRKTSVAEIKAFVNDRYPGNLK